MHTRKQPLTRHSSGLMRSIMVTTPAKVMIPLRMLFSAVLTASLMVSMSPVKQLMNSPCVFPSR